MKDRRCLVDEIEATLTRYLSIGRSDMGEEVFADFLVFCWQTLDPGTVAGLDLDSSLVGRLNVHLSALMDESEGFSESSAPAFWRRYIEWADMGEEFEVNDCVKIMMLNPGYREPCFHICSVTQGRQMKEEALRLFASLDGVNTVRARYVRSVIQSVLGAVG